MDLASSLETRCVLGAPVLRPAPHETKCDPVEPPRFALLGLPVGQANILRLGSLRESA